MCGRFALSKKETLLKDRFKVKEVDPEYKRSFNIAPGANVPVILNKESDKILLAKWGYTPHWMKEEKAFSVINARAEEIDTKNFFKKSFLTQRCLILADSFYEWQKTGGEKVPYCIFLKDQACFAFAGLWDIFKGRITCTIITTQANELIKPVHHRMPVILDEKIEEEWLGKRDKDILKNMLLPYGSSQMEMYAISNLVNSLENDSEEILKPVEE